MKRLLLHSQSHEFVVVDITNVERSNADPRKGNRQAVPGFRFVQSEAKDYLRTIGADEEMIETTFKTLRKQSVAVLTIL